MNAVKNQQLYFQNVILKNIKKHPLNSFISTKFSKIGISMEICKNLKNLSIIEPKQNQKIIISSIKLKKNILIKDITGINYYY